MQTNAISMNKITGNPIINTHPRTGMLENIKKVPETKEMTREIMFTQTSRLNFFSPTIPLYCSRLAVTRNHAKIPAIRTTHPNMNCGIDFITCSKGHSDGYTLRNNSHIHGINAHRIPIMAAMIPITAPTIRAHLIKKIIKSTTALTMRRNLNEAIVKIRITIRQIIKNNESDSISLRPVCAV